MSCARSSASSTRPVKNRASATMGARCSSTSRASACASPRAARVMRSGVELRYLGAVGRSAGSRAGGASVAGLYSFSILISHLLRYQETKRISVRMSRSASAARGKATREALIAALFLEVRQMSTGAIMFHQAIADRLGLHPTDHKCADLIMRHGAMTSGRLAELTGLTTGAITGVVDRLESRGLARRATDPRDRRRVIVELVKNTAVECQVRDL